MQISVLPARVIFLNDNDHIRAKPISLLAALGACTGVEMTQIVLQDIYAAHIFTTIVLIQIIV